MILCTASISPIFHFTLPGWPCAILDKEVIKICQRYDKESMAAG